MATRLRAPRIDFGTVHRELELPGEFQLAVVREAEQSAGRAVRDSTGTDVADLTDIPFVTIDPPGARDLDQAMCLERRRPTGYRVRYAIADVAAFVHPGGALDTETWRRGCTIYLPDGRVPLHPPVLSEGAASLLPDVERRAVVWTIDLDPDGHPVAVDVRRAVVRSRAQLDYPAVQARLDANQPVDEPLALLVEIGRLRRDRGHERGAVDLPLPDQEVTPDGEGWRLQLRAPAPIEEDNAQISLLTGACAAQLMLGGGAGLLRTLPPATADAVAKLRTAALALGVSWPDGTAPAQVISTVDPAAAHGAAFLDLAGEVLLRGAGYTAFDGTPPEQTGHGAVGEPYAHVTAPLRRLADRYATEVCLAVCAGTPVPDWARAALPELPRAMAEADRRAKSAERAAIDLTEAVLLAGRVGQTFAATVLDVDPAGKGKDGGKGGGTIALDDPPVRARCDGPLTPGVRVMAQLTEADPARRRVRFQAG